MSNSAGKGEVLKHGGVNPLIAAPSGQHLSWKSVNRLCS